VCEDDLSLWVAPRFVPITWPEIWLPIWYG
jgi:hypothetical protein